MRWSSFFLVIILLSGTACRQKNTPEAAFYHWQTNLAIDTAQAALLQNLQAKRLYVKFFDVDWNASQQQLVPQASLQVEPDKLAGIQEVVPTVFITNRSFLEAPEGQIEELPEKVLRKISQLKEQFPDQILFREVQFDCDWTARSRAAFFDFLTQVSSKLQEENLEVSVTIRLHQLANPEGTGVPPASRGMLMFYNMGSLANWDEQNSILNLEAALPYLNRAARKYPLPLDMAIPVFNWGVLFRDGAFIRLVNNLDTAQLADPEQFEKLAAYRFRVRKSVYLQGRYLYKDDLIRVETVRPDQLKDTKVLLEDYLRKAHYISFYHLDATVLKQIPHADLEAFFE